MPSNKPTHVRNPIIIGLGTGRCGSTSLAKFLNIQPSCKVTHESNQHSLHWTGTYNLINDTLEFYREQQSQSPNQIFGDVHFAYLPYVFQIAQQYEEVRFVCLVRDKSETVTSWIRKIENRNPWLNHQGTLFGVSPWDNCFPKIGIPNPTSAAEHYWELYLKAASELQKELPSRFKIFPTGSLNTKQGQDRILDFVKVSPHGRVYSSNIRENAFVRKVSQ